jgi:hypothetical protein
MDVLIEDLASQDLIHQTFFGSSYLIEGIRKMQVKRGMIPGDAVK